MADVERVANILCLAKGPVRTGPPEGRKMRGALSEQVTLTLPVDFWGKFEPRKGGVVAAKEHRGHKMTGTTANGRELTRMGTGNFDHKFHGFHG